MRAKQNNFTRNIAPHLKQEEYLHYTPLLTGTTQRQRKNHQARWKTWVKRRRITTYGSFKKDRRRTLNQYSKSSKKEN
jgi:hypothetical protein